MSLTTLVTPSICLTAFSASNFSAGFTTCPRSVTSLQSGPSECPLLDVALTASVSATDSVPQNDHAVAEPVLVNQFQLQPHTIREEPLFRRRRPQGRRTFAL